MALAALSHPHWQGAQKWAIYLLFPKTLFFLAYFVLSLVEWANYKKWADHTNDDVVGFHLRGVMVYVVEWLWTIISTALIIRGSFHPLLPSILALPLAGFWVFASFYAGLIGHSNEVWFKYLADHPNYDMRDEWERLMYGEAGLAALAALLYFFVFGFSVLASCRATKFAKRNGLKGMGPFFGKKESYELSDLPAGKNAQDA